MMIYWIMFLIWLGVMLVAKILAHDIVDNYGIAGTLIVLSIIFFIGCVIEGRKQGRATKETHD